MTEFICEYCMEPFSCEWRHKAKRRRYCSTRCACRDRANIRSARIRAARKTICAHCGVEFFRKGKPKFCSRKCWRDSLKPPSRPCTTCGEQLGRAGVKFCSVACRDAGRTVKSKCLFCGAVFKVPKSQYDRSPGAGMFCSNDCAVGWRVGSNNPNWKGGKSFEPYPVAFNAALKRHVRQSFGHRCVMCKAHKDDLGYKLIVHHVDYDKSNCGCRNLVLLCRSCHGKTNGKREYWTKFFGEEFFSVRI